MTTENQSGKSLLPKDRLANFEKILNEYNSTIGLSGIKRNSEIELILNLDASSLKNMAAEDCGECAFLLFQYSTYIQKEYNRQVVRKMWAEKELQIMLGRYGHQYGDKFTKYEERMAKMIVDDSAASLLNNILIHASARVSELQDLSTRINMMGRSLLDYQNTKSRARI